MNVSLDTSDTIRATFLAFDTMGELFFCISKFKPLSFNILCSKYCLQVKKLLASVQGSKRDYYPSF